MILNKTYLTQYHEFKVISKDKIEGNQTIEADNDNCKNLIVISMVDF